LGTNPFVEDPFLPIISTAVEVKVFDGNGTPVDPAPR